MRWTIIAVGVAAALVSCKANLERHDYDGGDIDLGIGEKPNVDATDGRDDAQGTGGTTMGTGGTSGLPDGGTTGSGGTPVDAGEASGGGPGSGGSGGSGGTASGGAGGAADAAVDAGADTSVDAELARDAAADKPADAGVDAPPPSCTQAETRCAGDGMQTCGANATWGATTACGSAICSGKKCLPQSAILIVGADGLFVYDAQTGGFSSSFAFKEQRLSGGGLGPDGKLWLVDVAGRAVVRYDLSGTSLGIFAALPDLGEFLAFGPDGNVYVTIRTIPRGTILRINAMTGASMETFVQGPLDLIMSGLVFHNGSLFVTYSGTGNMDGSLYQYNGTTGAFISTLYDSFSPYGPQTPAFAPDGMLYVPIWQTFDVAKFDATTLKFVANISQDKLYPMSIAVAPDGKLLILHDVTGDSASVQRFDPKTGTFSTFIPPGSGGVGRAHAILLR